MSQTDRVINKIELLQIDSLDLTATLVNCRRTVSMQMVNEQAINDWYEHPVPVSEGETITCEKLIEATATDGKQFMSLRGQRVLCRVTEYAGATPYSFYAVASQLEYNIQGKGNHRASITLMRQGAPVSGV